MSKEAIRLKSFMKEQRRHWKRLLKGEVPENKIIEGWIDSCQFAQADLMALLESELKAKDAALESLRAWVNAYPLDIFPAPDLKKAREVLKAAGMTLDSISADNMRHVLGEFAKSMKDVLP